VVLPANHFQASHSRGFLLSGVGFLANQSVEKLTVPATLVFGLIVSGIGYWANANDTKITKLEGAQRDSNTATNARIAANADAIQKLTSGLQMLEMRESMVEKAVEKAAGTAEKNEKILIRIAEKLQVKTD